MAKKSEQTDNDQETMQETEQETNHEEGQKSVGDQLASTQTEGIRARRGLTLKQMVPSQDWIMQNIVAGGKGTRATVGRIFGVVTSTQRKTNMVQDKAIESIACVGMLNAESYLTGEISQGSSVYFPMAYAEQVEAMFKADPSITVVEVDCDIGLEATGKAIPYEWVTTAYLEGKEMAVLKRMRNARKRPDNLLIAPDGTAKQLQLTAPGK